MAKEGETPDPKEEAFFSLMDKWADRREAKNAGKDDGDKDGNKGPVSSFLDSMFGSGK